MAKAIIVYHSEHHGNTKKLVDAIAAAHAADLAEADKAAGMDFSAYDAVGFASGIYMSGFHASLEALLNNAGLRGKKAFVLYTSGSGSEKYAAGFAAKLADAGLSLLGVYQCKGFDTFGPFKLIGGIAKGHPTAEDIDGAVRLYERSVLPALAQR